MKGRKQFPPKSMGLTECMENYYFTFLNEEHKGVKIETADSDVKKKKIP
jgi:hypothetical protein